MNRQTNTKSNTGSCAAFQTLTPTIDFSNRDYSKLKRRVQLSNSDEKIISEEELLQHLWQC